MERFKQENSTVKSSIGENFLDIFIETTKEFKKLDEVYDAEEIIKTKKMHFKHGRRWFSWEDQTRENMRN